MLLLLFINIMLLGGFNISCFGNALNRIEISAEEWA